MIKDRASRKMRPGFTLADMLVATSIIVTISVVLVVNFRTGRQRDELRSTGLLLASIISQAQTYTLAGRTVEIGGVTVATAGGWGVSFDALADRAYVFADNGDRLFNTGTELWQEAFILADYKTQFDENNVCVDLGSGCEAGITRVDYVFVPPLGSRSILGNSFNLGSFEIIIRHLDLPGKGMRLTGNAATGQAILGPIEDIP